MDDPQRTFEACKDDPRFASEMLCRRLAGRGMEEAPHLLRTLSLAAGVPGPDFDAWWAAAEEEAEAWGMELVEEFIAQGREGIDWRIAPGSA